jgi:hypothetical protein
VYSQLLTTILQLLFKNYFFRNFFASQLKLVKVTGRKTNIGYFMKKNSSQRGAAALNHLGDTGIQ